jgi:hypothetical protein
VQQQQREEWFGTPSRAIDGGGERSIRSRVGQRDSGNSEKAERNRPDQQAEGTKQQTQAKGTSKLRTDQQG